MIVLVEKRDDRVHLELTIPPHLLTFAHSLYSRIASSRKAGAVWKWYSGMRFAD